MIYTLILSVLFSSAGPGGFELGIILGEPSGISAKTWFDGNTALDGAVSWSLKGEHKNDLYLHADFLWHDFNVVLLNGILPFYYGIGGRVILANDTRFGARVPAGISWYLSGVPLDLFFELAAVVDIIPNTDFDINGGIGIRFIF